MAQTRVCAYSQGVGTPCHWVLCLKPSLWRITPRNLFIRILAGPIDELFRLHGIAPIHYFRIL